MQLQGFQVNALMRKSWVRHAPLFPVLPLLVVHALLFSRSVAFRLFSQLCSGQRAGYKLAARIQGISGSIRSSSVEVAVSPIYMDVLYVGVPVHSCVING